MKNKYIIDKFTNLDSDSEYINKIRKLNSIPLNSEYLDIIKIINYNNQDFINKYMVKNYISFLRIINNNKIGFNMSKYKTNEK